MWEVRDSVVSVRHDGGSRHSTNLPYFTDSSAARSGYSMSFWPLRYKQDSKNRTLGKAGFIKGRVQTQLPSWSLSLSFCWKYACKVCRCDSYLVTMRQQTGDSKPT